MNALQFAVLLLIMCSVWRLQNLYTILTPLQLPILSTLAAIGLTISSKDPRQRLAGVKHPLTWLVLTILALSFISVLMGVYPGYSLSFILNDFIKNVALMLLVAVGTRNINDSERIVATQALGASLYAFVSITTFHTDSSGRLGELFYYDANDVAMVLVSSLPFLLYMGITARRWQWKLATVIGLGLVMVSVMRAGSRGGFLALVAITLFLLFRFGGVKGWKRFSFVLVLTGAFLVTATDATWRQLQSMMNPSGDYNMTEETGRKAIWTRGIGYMMERPVFGVGVNCFSFAEGHLSELSRERAAKDKGLKWSAAHNSFVQIGAELGFPGLLSFVGMLLIAFRTLVRIRRRFPDPSDDHQRAKGLTDALTASLIGYCVAGFFLSQAYGGYIYLTIGAIVGLDKVTGPSLAGRKLVAGVRHRHLQQARGPRGQVLRPRPAT
jgi:O-antigen ligase